MSRWIFGKCHGQKYQWATATASVWSRFLCRWSGRRHISRQSYTLYTKIYSIFCFNAVRWRKISRNCWYACMAWRKSPCYRVLPGRVGRKSIRPARWDNLYRGYLRLWTYRTELRRSQPGEQDVCIEKDTSYRTVIWEHCNDSIYHVDETNIVRNMGILSRLDCSNLSNFLPQHHKVEGLFQYHHIHDSLMMYSYCYCDVHLIESLMVNLHICFLVINNSQIDQI